MAAQQEFSVTRRIVDEMDAGAARRTAWAMAEAAAFGRADVYALAIAVSELAHNLVFHTLRGGTISLRLVRRHGRQGVEVVASDDGPGIADVALALTDGYTTGHGLGGGLPGVKRLMDEFELSSSPAGTRIRALKWAA